MAKSTTELEIVIKEEMQKALTSIDQLGAKLDGIGNKLDGTATKADKIGKSFKNVANLTGLITAFKSVFTAMNKVESKAQDYTEQLNLFNVVFKNTEKNGVQMYSKIGLEATKFQNKLQENFGAYKTQTMRYQALFQSMGESSGINEDVANTMSKAMTKMSYDLASLFNREEKDVAEALKAGVYAGQTKPMRQYGIDITQTSMQPIADSLGLDKSISQMSQAEKQMLRYIAVLKQGRVAMGDFANTIESPANQLKVLRQQVQELGVAIGSLFMGMFQKILPYVNAILMVLKEVIKTIAGIFGIKLRDYNTGVAATSDYFEDVGKSAGGATKKAKELKKEVMSFDQIHNIDTPTDNKSGGSGGGGVGSIDPKLLAAIKDYENGMENVRMKAVQIRDQIMEWLGFTKQVDAKTGEITWKLKDGWSNLKTIGAILGGAAILGTIAKIIKLVNSLKIVSGIKNVISLFPTLKAGISVFGTGIKEMFAGTASFKDVIGALSPKLATLGPLVAKLGVAAAGTAVSIVGMTKTSKNMQELTKGTMDADQAFGKFAASTTLSVGGATAAGAAIGSIIPGIGTLAGAIGGALVGAIGNGIAAWKGYQKAIEEIAYNNVFGNITISVEEFAAWFGENSFLDNAVNKINIFQDTMKTLTGEWANNAVEIDKYLYKFGELGMKITDEEGPKFKEALDTTFKDAKEIVSTNTQATIDSFVGEWARGTSLSAEEQKRMIAGVQKHGQDTQTEIDKTQTEVNKIWKNGIDKRGYLTDEEYKKLQKAMAKLKKLLENEVDSTQGDILLKIDTFNTDSAALTEESYKNYKTAADAYRTTQKTKWDTYYNDLYAKLETAHKNHSIDDKEYYKTREDYAKNYQKAMEEVEETIKTNNETLTKKLKEKYISLADDTSDEARKTKENIEKVFQEIDPTIDLTDLRNQGKSCAEEFNKNFQNNFKDRYTTTITPQLNPKYQTLTIGSSKVELKIGGKADGGIFANGKWNKITQYANGGLPSQGQMFIAREAGPELVGKIGNRTAVMNNGQIVDSVANGVARAVASVMGNNNGGAIQVVVHTDEGVVVDRINRITDTTGTCPIRI